MDPITKYQKTFVTVIIPARNEVRTIVPIVRTVKAHPWVSQVIVVDDGSTDGTARSAQAAGADVLKLGTPHGKGAALNAGVSAAREDILCFLDADTIGLTEDMITRIIEPVRNRTCAMHVGIRGRKLYWLNKLLRISPILGGERCLTRTLWQMVPLMYKKNYQIELALNFYCKLYGGYMAFTIIHGLHQIIKEKKWGLLPGFRLRLGMMTDIISISVRLYAFEKMKLKLLGLQPIIRLPIPVKKRVSS